MASETPVGHEKVAGSLTSAVTSIREEILSKLKAYRFSEEDIFAVHLALEEAFINAVRHGHKMDATIGVEIDYSVTLDKVEVTVTDEGEGFDPESVPDPRFGENLYKPEGRGLFLMRSYMDVVKFNERGNSVFMVKNKASQEPINNESQTQS